jgi:membrane protein DedA with SNARE-associated domain
MDLPGLIDSYGYLAVFIGAFLEGETVLALAGLAANRGYLDFPTVVLIAMCAGFLGDQFYFFLGRHKGAKILARFPHAEARAHQLDALLSRWHAPLIIGIRFMYGLRILGPVMLGMGRVRTWKFVVFNFIGAAIWAPLVAGIGYVFGTLLESVLGDLKRIEVWGFVALVALGLALFFLHWLRARREDRRADARL